MTKARKSPDDSGSPDAAASLARAEAIEILECIQRDLDGVAALVDREKSALTTGKRVSSKRLARLRLVAQDLDSAHRLAGRSRR